MTRAWIAAARADEVRDAARGWAHAKAIDAPTLSAIEASYPASRSELHPAWRVLIFLLICVALLGVFLGVFHDVGDILWPSALYAVILMVATEFLRWTPASESGTDAATSLMGLVFAIFAVTAAHDKWNIHLPDETTLAYVSGAVLCALAAWHWGFWVYALGATACGYRWLGRMPFARPVWIVVAVLLMILTSPRLDRAALAPPHRRSLAGVFAISSTAMYAAVNLFALDRAFIERIRLRWLLGDGAVAPVDPALRLAAALATAVFPVVFFLWGIRTRRRLLLGIGLASAVLSVATFRHYFPIGPRWAWLTACGAVLIAAALWAHRRLRDAPGGVWRGLTASPLYAFDDAGISPLGALGAQVAVAPATPERPGFTGGGGSFGGGGASGQY